MKPDLTHTLCTRCGLCCDGSLFADVELAGPSEATRLEILGLGIEEESDAVLLVQPCAALHGRRCVIYAHRPRCCRTFECRLLQETRRARVSVKQAAARIADTLEGIGKVKVLLRRLGQRDTRLPLKERCAEVFAAPAGAGAAAKHDRAELERAMQAVELDLDKHYL